MTSQIGFGKVQPQQQKVKKNKAKRVAAARQYDEMKKSGLPEFNVYVRIQGQRNWFPVGAIAVSRSNQINKAVFEQEEELLKGAFRLFPKLRKHKNQLEYGYRLKEYNDEPIALAVRPQPTTADWIQSTITSVKERFSAITKRS